MGPMPIALLRACDLLPLSIPYASRPTPQEGAQDPHPPRTHDDSEMQRFLDTYSHVAKAMRQEAASCLDILLGN